MNENPLWLKQLSHDKNAACIMHSDKIITKEVFLVLNNAIPLLE